MKRTVIYNRCSTEEEAQINALAIQAAESREIVLKKGWQIVDQYIESESGTTAHKRSEYQRLLEDMEIDKFDIIVIKSIDRLMRSAKDWYIFVDKLTKNQKQLYIYIDNKFYTPDDSLLTGIKAILAEDFSRELSKKIKNAHKRRQTKRIGFNITVPIFGWNKIGKDVYEINEEEAEAYRLAFALAKEGKGFYSIANIMYHNGVRGKTGKRISDVQWRKMIYSPRAHGTVVLHTNEYDFEAKKKIKLPENEWIYVDDALPPIISKEYHTEVIEAICKRTIVKNRTRDMSSVGLYELSGKIYCAKCGAVYYRTSFASGDGKLTEWKCSTALKHGRRTEANPTGCNNINVIEDVVLETIEETCKKHYEVLFGNEENIIEEALSTIRKVICQNNGGKELDKLEKDLEKLERKKKVLFTKLMDEVIEDEDFKVANQELLENIGQLHNKINNIKAQGCEYNDYEVRLFKIKELLNSGIIDKARTKELITRIDKIVVHPNGMLEINFNSLRMLSLLKICGANLGESEMGGKLFKIQVRYIHKNNITRKREKINNEILQLFRENPELMLKEVPDILGVSKSYVNTSVKELKEKGLLRYKRYGNVHSGRWIVD